MKMRKMTARKNRAGGLALAGGLIAGVAGGAAAGLLLAPKAGRVTRRFVSQKGQRAYRNVRGKLGRDQAAD